MPNTRPALKLAHKAWHAGENDRPVIDVGEYDKDGGCEFEFLIEWEELRGQTVPKIDAYCDSWAAFARYPELFAKLAENHGNPVSPDEMEGILRDLGFEDMTKYERAPTP